MRRTALKTVFLITLSVILGACVSGKKALKRGDYYRACFEAVEHLRSSPNSKKAQETLLKAYPLAVSTSLRVINNTTNSNRINKYEVAADEYLALEKLTNTIYSNPRALELVPNPEDFSYELGQMLPLAAEETYARGLKLLANNTIESAREAYFSFIKSDSYIENYRDVASKIEESLFIATLKVIVEKPVTPTQYQLTADFFYDNLMSEISRVSRNQFIRFYTYEEARMEKLQHPDQYLVLNFEDFTVGNIRESKNTFEVKRDSVVTGTTKINGKTHQVYGTVKAKMTTNRREVLSKGVLSVQIINAANNRIEQRRNFAGQYVWINEWASYNGDERALSKEQILLTEAEPLMPPPQQALFVEFTGPIFSQVVPYINNYYRQYNK